MKPLILIDPNKVTPAEADALCRAGFAVEGKGAPQLIALVPASLSRHKAEAVYLQQAITREDPSAGVAKLADAQDLKS